MSDARAEVERTHGDVLTADLVHELIYADDTLLIDARGQVVQAYMDAVVSVGAQYGLQINWKKVELMAVRCNPDISDNIGQQIGNKSGIVYLGALLDSSGSIQSELVRRIGMATSDFKALATIWNHSNLTQYWKHRVFHTCIASKSCTAYKQRGSPNHRETNSTDFRRSACERSSALRLLIGVGYPMPACSQPWTLIP